MTDQQKLDEIITLMTFLQSYIQNNVEQSFTTLTFDLETLIEEYLNVFEKKNEQYENLNYLKHNYPAVDLVNQAKDIALQVTTNADARKVAKTIETYENHKIKYSNLIIIGFVKNTKKKFQNVEVYGVKYLIKLAKQGKREQKEKIYEILKNKVPWNSLSPLNDKLCFDIVFDVINRSAVRDYTICEGDFDKMVLGLSEIKEIITTGKIRGKSIRAKALVEYNEGTKNKLSQIEFNISSIIQICTLNKNKRQSSFVCLSMNETDEIDNLKEKIINSTNALANELGLSKQITGSKR